MQRMICISAQQYNKMMEAYDEAMNELQDLRQQLREVHERQEEAAAVQEVDVYRGAIRELIDCSNDTEYLKAVYSFAVSYPCDEGIGESGDTADQEETYA